MTFYIEGNLSLKSQVPKRLMGRCVRVPFTCFSFSSTSSFPFKASTDMLKKMSESLTCYVIFSHLISASHSYHCFYFFSRYSSSPNPGPRGGKPVGGVGVGPVSPSSSSASSVSSGFLASGSYKNKSFSTALSTLIGCNVVVSRKKTVAV